jgi:hypothetical protein
MRTRSLAAVAATALLALALVGCASETDTDEEPPAAVPGQTTEQGDLPSLVTLPGDGTYLVPDQAPYGSYQIVGEPDSQPDGCTWTLFDSNGAELASDNGVYVFIEDTVAKFTTTGCGEWEQYE